MDEIDAAGRHTGCVVREDAEELRRRLYAPGASADDVDRFREVAPAAVAVLDDPLPRPPRRRLVPLLAVLGLAVLVVAGIAVARITTTSEAAVPAPTPVRMSADDRQEIEDNLAAGNGAGIAAFLVTHRSPPALLDVHRAFTFEASGTGDGVAVVSPVGAQTVEGRATVLLALARSGEGGWTVFRRQVGPGGEEQLIRQRQRAGEQEAGALTTDTFRYASGDRPVEIHVTAPAGVRWGVAVVLSD